LSEKILTVTFNPTVDAASETERVQATRKIRTFDESFHPGGGGINVARVIHRLGGDVSALYVLDHLLEERGVPHQTIEISGNTRINNVIHETSTGLEYRFVAEGPVFNDEDWQYVVKACEQAPWVWLVVSGSLPRGIPLEIYDRFIDMARARGGKIVIDTSGEALKYVIERGGLTLLKPSQGEFEAYAGCHFASLAELAQTAQSLVQKGVSDIIAVTLGHQGAVLASAQAALYLPSPPVKVLSASGAGDSFIAGMIYALSEGQSLEEAFCLGVACGSAAVMEKGTRLCQKTHIARLLQSLSPVQSAIVAIPLEEE